MAATARTYWLTEPCRIRRDDQSIAVERPDGSRVRVPVTDVRDLVAFDHVDINTSAVSLLGHHGIVLHVLDHYGNSARNSPPLCTTAACGDASATSSCSTSKP